MPAPSDSPPPDIFDRRLRRLRRDRSARIFPDHAFLTGHVVESLLDRLDAVTRSFATALNLGCQDGALTRALQARGLKVVNADPGFSFAHNGRGVQCDEDRLPFADASFDLVLSSGGLDQVNDLPGALTLIRRALRPDGLFLAALIGATSLPRLRHALLQANGVTGAPATPRLHPQIDVRSGGDLLGRAGFALQVADSERLTIRYRDVFRLMADLRGMAATNLLVDQHPPLLTRGQVAAIAEAYQASADEDGRVSETVEILFLTGWSPGPDQPRPARRGSGAVSLHDALRPKGEHPAGR